MTALRLDDATVVFGSHVLSSAVADIDLPLDEEGDSGWATDRLVRLAGLESHSLTFSGHWDGPSPLLDVPTQPSFTILVPWHIARRWLALRERRRARVRRMHAAYHRRRGSGRW